MRILLAMAAGAVISLASLALSDREWIHASEWDPSVPLHESTYISVIVWGRPLAFVRDSPVEGTPGSIDPADTLRPGCLLVDWVLFTGASAAVSAVFRRARKRLQDRGSMLQRLEARAADDSRDRRRSSPERPGYVVSGTEDGAVRARQGTARVLAGALVPWVAVLLFWTLLHSAWATILAYHVMMLAFSRRELARAFRGWNPRILLLSAAPCLLAGPVTWLLLPSVTLAPIGGWLEAFGLKRAALCAMVPYYGLVHPFVEQAHWSRLRSDPRLGLISSLLFAGYHGLVLSTLMKPLWVGLCIAVLIVTSISWRRIEARCGGGLLVPALTQVIADAGMIVAAVLRTG